MYQRFAETLAKEALKDTPVVLIQGPRKIGKTTLLNQINQFDESYEYITFEDEQVRNYAQSNPIGFLRGKNRVILDEVHHVPSLYPEISRLIELDPQPGRFLLAASANVYSLANPENSLTGKIESIDLLPLSQFELFGKDPNFLKKLFNGTFDTAPQHPIVGEELRQTVLKGGFPESLSSPSKETRAKWMSTYLNEELIHNVDEIAEIDNLIAIPHFVQGLAEYTGHIINYSRLGRKIGMSYKSGQRYLDLLEQIYLTAPIYPIHDNQLKSVIKAPKLQFFDTGLFASLLDLKFNQNFVEMEKFDQLVKNFVFSELSNLVQQAGKTFNISFYRGFNEREVDFIVDNGNQIAGVSVTSNASIKNKDFSSLRSLKADAKDLFAFGVLLYDGETVDPFEDDLFAIPISTLWD